MDAIGKRAARAIRDRAYQKGHSVRQEILKLGLTSQIIYNWERDGKSPSAYTLQQMYFAGYDVIYILTGKENKNVTD